MTTWAPSWGRCWATTKPILQAEVEDTVSLTPASPPPRNQQRRDNQLYLQPWVLPWKPGSLCVKGQNPGVSRALTHQWTQWPQLPGWPEYPFGLSHCCASSQRTQLRDKIGTWVPRPLLWAWWPHLGCFLLNWPWKKECINEHEDNLAPTMPDRQDQQQRVAESQALNGELQTPEFQVGNGSMTHKNVRPTFSRQGSLFPSFSKLSSYKVSGTG
jgi:hypothetical protein